MRLTGCGPCTPFHQNINLKPALFSAWRCCSYLPSIQYGGVFLPSRAKIHRFHIDQYFGETEYQSGDDDLTPLVRLGERLLSDYRVAIAVSDDTQQPIGFGMNEASWPVA